jgi:hypothetical protein
MKKIVTIVVAMIFVLGLASFGFAAGIEKCEKCHKGDKTVDKMIVKAGVVTAADLTKTLRDGKKAGMHKPLTDEDLKGAAAALNLK